MVFLFDSQLLFWDEGESFIIIILWVLFVPRQLCLVSRRYLIHRGRNLIIVPLTIVIRN